MVVIMKDFDELFEQKMKMGLYQYIMIYSACVLQFTNGAFQLLIPIAAKRVQNELFFSMDELYLITSVYQIGILTGGLFVGYLADKYGRYQVLRYNCLFGLTVLVLLFFANSIATITVSNYMLGLFSSSHYVVLVNYLFEHLPAKSRGRITVIFKSFTTIGRTLGVQIVAYVMNPYQEGFWKTPILATGFSIVTSFIFFLFILRESLRFSYSAHHYTNLFANFNYILKLNRVACKNKETGTVAVSADDINILKTNSLLRRSAFKTETNFLNFFSRKYLYLNVALTLNKTFIQACFGGFMTVFPFIFGTDKIGLDKITFIISGEFVGTILCGFIVDSIFFGRKNTILLCNFMGVILFLLVPFGSSKILVLLAFMTRIFCKCALTAIEIYAVEAYPIKMRALAAGVSTVIVGTALACFPFIFGIMKKWNENAIYFLMSFLLMASFLLAFFLPKDVER